MSTVIKMKRKPQPKQRKNFMVTWNNPDPTENPFDRMKEMMPDVARVVGGYEIGDKDHTPHWQLYVTTFEAHRESEYYEDEVWTTKCDGECEREHGEMVEETYWKPRCKLPVWLKIAYAPTCAEQYCVKADHTLIPWKEGEKGHVKLPGFGEFDYRDPLFERKTQGMRSELKACMKAIREGGTYVSFMEDGLFLEVCAKYKAWIIKQESLTTVFTGPIKWPVKFNGHVMTAPDKMIKKRHFWISGAADMGKSTMVFEMLGQAKYFYTKGANKNFLETYNNQELLVLDDCFFFREQLIQLCDFTHRGTAIAGRHVDGWLKEQTCRNVIVIDNSCIDEYGFKKIDGLKERFIEIRVGVPVEAGYRTEPGASRPEARPLPPPAGRAQGSGFASAHSSSEPPLHSVGSSEEFD